MNHLNIYETIILCFITGYGFRGIPNTWGRIVNVFKNCSSSQAAYGFFLDLGWYMSISYFLIKSFQ